MLLGNAHHYQLPRGVTGAPVRSRFRLVCSGEFSPCFAVSFCSHVPDKGTDEYYRDKYPASMHQKVTEAIDLCALLVVDIVDAPWNVEGTR